MREKIDQTRRSFLKKFKSRIQPGPLNDVIILGYCNYVSGPTCLQTLARQGGLVIKIEPKPHGDPTRQVFSPDLFNSLTHNQLSLAVNPKEKKDRLILTALFHISHVIVDNRSVRAKKNDTILQSYLREPNKTHSKIYCSIDAFSNNDLTGVDASVQAATGLAYTNCTSREKPMKVGIPILDQMTGVLAALHISTNLYFLNQPILQQTPLPASTNNVIHIAISLAGVSVWLQTGQMLEALEGKEFFRSGNEDRFAAPFSYYKAKDGFISIATVNEKQFEDFCRYVLKDEDFHKQYPTIRKRIQEHAKFELDLNAKLKKEAKSYWIAKCQKYRVPASPVLTVSETIQQSYVKPLIEKSTDGRKVITTGARNSFFNTRPLSEPAPPLNGDGEMLSDLSSSLLGKH